MKVKRKPSQKQLIALKRGNLTRILQRIVNKLESVDEAIIPNNELAEWRRTILYLNSLI